MNDVLILREPDAKAQAQARRAGLTCIVSEELPSGIEFDRALIVEPGQMVQWHLVPYGMHFLERWDAAVPLWRYGVLAQDLGTTEERKRTQAVVRDLRVLLYAHELLFVRDSSGGRNLLRCWEEELAGSEEPRLAFLRALYRVKPIFCTLPQSWAGQMTVRPARLQAITRTERREQVHIVSPRVGRNKPPVGLVSVEVSPGVYVRCKPGQEADVLKRLKKSPRAKEG